MKKEIKDHLLFFGYTNHPEIDHNTAFFEYTEQSKGDLALFKAFEQKNAETLEKLLQVSEQKGKSKASYYFNQEGNDKFKLSGMPTCFTDITFAEP